MPANAPVAQRHTLRLHRRELELMGALAQSQAQSQAEGYSRWQQAKARSHFNLFAPALHRDDADRAGAAEGSGGHGGAQAGAGLVA